MAEVTDMRDREWFTLGCRFFGVWVAYTALTYFSAYLDVSLGYTEELGRSSKPGGLLVHGFAHLALALYLLLGTPHLAWLCYERDEPLKQGLPTEASSPERDLS